MVASLDGEISLYYKRRVGRLHVFVAAPSFRRTLSRDLRIPGGQTARSSGKIPPLSSLILPTITRASSLERMAIDTAADAYRTI